MIFLPRRFKELLKQIDLFSIPVPVLTNDAKTQYSSFYSGLISVVVSVLSLAYFSYVIQEWANGNILPTITSSQQAISYTEQELNENFIEIKLTDPTNQDPFKRTNNIITPLFFEIENFTIVNTPQPLFSDENQPFQIGFKKGSLVVNQQNNQIDSKTQKAQKIFLLIFTQCIDSYLDGNSTCASQQEIDKYMSEYHGFISINMKLEQYSFKKDKVEYITKQSIQALSPKYNQFTQIAIQQKEINIDNGILFENQITYKLINDFYLVNQSIDDTYIQNTVSSFSTYKFQMNAILAYQITLDNLQISEKIIMPKLSAILAYIGSIVQVIFMLKYLAILINNQQLKEEMQTDIIQMYYPNLKNIIIKRNFLGKIVQVNQSNGDIQIKNENILNQYQEHLNLAFQKLRLTNIVYELSRIELLMEKHFGFENVSICNQLGTEFQFNNQYKKNESERISILSPGNQGHQNTEDIFKLFNKI